MKPRNLFFIHIPKTGGATIEELLNNTYAKQRICPYYYADDFLTGNQPPDAFSIFYGHNWFYTTQILPTPRFIFTYLRHPVGLAISVYEHIRRNPHTLHDLLISEAPSLSGFSSHKVFREMVSNPQTRIIGVDTNFKDIYQRVRNGKMKPKEANQQLMREILTEPDDDMLQRACLRIEQMDFVGITEYFNQSIRALSCKLDLALPELIPQSNAATAQDKAMRSEYSDNELKSLLEINKYDIQLYDFALRNFRNRYPLSTVDTLPADKHVQRYLHLR